MFDDEPDSKGTPAISRPLFEVACSVCNGAIFPFDDAWYDPNDGAWTHKKCYVSKDSQLSLF